MKTIFLLFFLIPLAFADSYEIAYQKGKVEIFRNKKEVTSGPVLPGDVIKVHKRSLLVLKSPQEVLKIMHDTVITPRETKEGTLIDLVKGAIVSKVTKKKFKVRTKHTVMGVRGTQFFVAISGSDDAWMCVNEGTVVVQKKGKKIAVPAGKGVFIDKKDISKPAAFAWTRKINWKMDASEGELDHNVNLNYDVLENFYD